MALAFETRTLLSKDADMQSKSAAQARTLKGVTAGFRMGSTGEKKSQLTANAIPICANFNLCVVWHWNFYDKYPANGLQCYFYS